MDDAQLAKQQPGNIDETLRCMRHTLEVFHAHRDKRAIFLRLYYLMTREVYAAVNEIGAYAGRTVFLDPSWLKRLSGLFASAYFRSLDPARTPEERGRAWCAAHAVAADPRSPVLENALLGINAHINYDLPQAIAANLREHDDLKDALTLQRRKFDHDQVNLILARTVDPVQRTIGEDYGHGIDAIDRLFGPVDDQVSDWELAHYREQVWWHALAFAGAEERGDSAVVRDALDRTSGELATLVDTRRNLWRTENALERLADLHDQAWDTIVIEPLPPGLPAESTASQAPGQAS
jgi:Family of unknown function (DUF5995)